MRVLIVCFTLLTFFGCSSSPTNETKYYAFELNTNQSSTPSLVHTNKPRLIILPVAMSGSSAQQALVQFLPDRQVSIANYHFWAESPDLMLTKDIINTLSTTQDKFAVVHSDHIYQVKDSDLILRIEVSNLIGHHSKGSILDGHWYLYKTEGNTRNLLHSSQFNIIEKLNENGFPALVQAHQNNWIKLTESIVSKLKMEK